LRIETEIGLVVSPFFMRWKDQDIERLKRGGCYEREKQRGKGKQEGATEKPQREETDEEGEEKQVGWTVSMIRQDELAQVFIFDFAIVVSSIKKMAVFRCAYSACCGGQA